MAIVILKYNYFFLLGDVCTCVGIRNRHRQFPWKHDNKTVGIIMSITKTLFEVTAINIISPAKNINEEGKKIPTKLAIHHSKIVDNRSKSRGLIYP